MVKAVFLDKDGIINELVSHNGIYTAPWKIKEFKYIKNIKKAVNILKKCNFRIYVVTNQPDVKDGNLEENDMNFMMNKIIKDLDVDEIFIALDRNCNYYKPNNGMLELIIKEYDIDREKSYLIGDRWKDIVCGYKSDIYTIYVGDEYETPDKYEYIKPNAIVKNVLEASYLIEEMNNYD